MRKKQPIAIVVLIFLVLLLSRAIDYQSTENPAGNATITSAYQNKQSDILVEGEGVVLKTLPDDLKGSKHQRFILEIAPEHTVLIAHNIDLAPKAPVRKGSRIRFAGEYEWNQKGGVIHWTHHDPKGKHPGGWLELNGKKYQ